jgi:acyl-CoA dehydrogenase
MNPVTRQQGPAVVEPLKAQARAAGLWNLFLPDLRDDEPGTRLSNLDYAPLAEIMGRVPWASEVFNCSAPDTGNMELLHLFATPAQASLAGAAAGRHDPLVLCDDRARRGLVRRDQHLQTRIQRDGDDYVCSTAASGSSPARCTRLPAGGRDGRVERRLNAPGAPAPQHAAGADGHALACGRAQHAGDGAPGLDGHCELVFRNVRCRPPTCWARRAPALRWRRRAWARGGCTTACAPSASASWRWS